MADEKTCPHCGKPVPPTSLGGICPECMLKAGLATQTEGPGATGPHGTKVTPPLPKPEEIAPLFPQLEILECLGRGGMGVVYKARQPRLNRLVALKILAREKEQDAQFAERFTREAQALARLNHPNIVTVYDFGSVGQASRLSGEHANASPELKTAPPTLSAGAGETRALHYLVMEFVDGLNLRQLLQAGKMKPEQALAIVPKICEALQYAHEQGIVHRDIKPENILLDKQGRVKIADFGIAKMLGGGDALPRVQADQQVGPTRLTEEGHTIGTPHYMAPEQIEKPLTVDHRADIYSLGVVFYEMLTGELPLGKFQPPSKKVHVDVRLDEVVLHALEKEPERRYQQASVLKTEVETIAATPESSRSRREEAQTEKAGSHPDASGTPAATAFRRGKRVALWVFVLIVLAASVITFLLPKAYVGIARVELTGLSSQNYNPYYVQTEFQVIKSDRVLKKVATSLNLGQRWGKQFNGGRPLNNDQVMVLMRRWIDLEPVRNTDMIDIGVWSQSPKDAPAIANKIAETYCALSPGPRGEIIDHAVAPFHPIRPNFLLNIFIGVVAGGVIGIFAGLAVGLSSFWRLHAIQLQASPPAQKPDRFWRRFAITVLALIIFVPVAFFILTIALPIIGQFAVDRQLQGQEQLVNESIRSDYIGQVWFPEGDSIKITFVDRTKNQMTVKGHYNLVSHDRALLALYCTSTNRTNVPEDSTQRVQISKGQGDFELARFHLFPGLHHVSMYADGHSFAAVYFGTKAEALEESKASWITNQATSNGGGMKSSNAVKFGPVFDRVLVDSKIPFKSESVRTNAMMMIDFDSGRLFSGSQRLWEANTNVQRQWMQTNGIDALCVVPQAGGLVGLDMKVLPVPPQAWNETTTRILGQLRRSPRRETVLINTEDSMPPTWLFQTREGSIGILQITGFTENPRGVKIRYKLVRESNIDSSPAEVMLARKGLAVVSLSNELWQASVTFRNHGRITSPAFYILFYAGPPQQNGRLISRNIVGPIAPDQTFCEATPPFVLRHSETDIYAVVDPENSLQRPAKSVKWILKAPAAVDQGSQPAKNATGN